jgi:Domain of unknown function (DUF5666)
MARGAAMPAVATRRSGGFCHGPGNQEQRVEGAVANLAGACPARSFSVAGRAVSTSATTRFDDTSCAALVIGMRVEVRGLLNGNGTLDAFRVSRKD